MSEREPTWVVSGSGGRRAIALYRLTVRKGPDAGASVEVSAPQAVLGALQGCALQLTDPTVSGLHVELSHGEHGLRVRDLGSRNGTFVDGVRVGEAFVTRACTLGLGRTELSLAPLAGTAEVAASAQDSFGPLLGKSQAMRELFAQLQGAAKTESTVLIEGETGTGKELVAEALVQASARAAGPLVVVDCAALTPTLVESQLFGHEKGAFTGATSSFAGAFERAAGGTVFLDELGELPLELQPRLLRVLERRQVQRLGGRDPVKVDVRVLAATHRALEREVNQGTFRADLFYRLSVLRVRVPALRERLDDVPLLARAFLPPGAALDEKTLARFAQHAWPGNVRELRNAVERVLAGADPLSAAAAAAPASPVGSLEQPFLVQKERLVADFERAYLEALLKACGGNLAEGARRAGVSRMAVVKLMTRHGLL